MAKSHLILAALAAAAVSGKNFVSTELTSEQTPGFDSATLTSAAGNHYRVLAPRNKQAERELAIELAALKLISPLASSTLKVPEIVGSTAEGSTSVAVLSFHQSKQIRLGSKNNESVQLLAAELARVHSLSVQEAQKLEIISYSPQELVAELVSELDKLADTGKIPGVLLSRWETALEDVGLWRYRPTVIHGGIGVDNVGTSGDQLVMRGFGSMRVSDPAEDLAWIAGGSSESVTKACFEQYSEIRDSDENLVKRAIFYSELEIARWLAYCIESQDIRAAEAAQADLENLAEDAQRSDLPSLEATSFIGLNSERTEG